MTVRGGAVFLGELALGHEQRSLRQLLRLDPLPDRVREFVGLRDRLEEMLIKARQYLDCHQNFDRYRLDKQTNK